ncbi:MAG: hypothetical protein IPM29_08385 [Planctomycetes bacterium]|nr:hypothetical protein [Planctomycetota bacterium]
MLILQLDAREALQRGYRLTFLRLAGIVDAALRSGTPDAARLFDSLLDADDHGLLEWCFSTRGGRVPPFSELRSAHPDVFAECARLTSTSQ